MGSQSSKRPSANRKPGDVVLVYRKSDDGKGFDVLRQRGGEIENGRLRPLDDGKPIHGEVVRLEPREESPALFNVEVQHDGRSSAGRPAKVVTDQYRKGWESIWANERPNRALN